MLMHVEIFGMPGNIKEQKFGMAANIRNVVVIPD
jgi:hypothetical protein